MGNACQICQEQSGNYSYDPSQRQFINTPIKSYNNNGNQQYSSAVIPSDAPNPALVRGGIVLPTLNPIITQIAQRQNTIKTFVKDNVTGTRLQPYQLKNKGMCYDGQWKNGVPHGAGRAYYSNGGFFQGYFKNGVADCIDGMFIYPDGTFYRGNIRDSSANGHGMLVFKNGQMIYTGQWMNDKPHGMGKQQYKDGSVYVGSFINGVKQGNGSFKWSDGSEYVGTFSNGTMNGEGNQKLANGQNYKGTFFRNKKQGRGVLQTSFGTYNGQFSQDKKAGEGQFRFPDGRVFKGSFLQNLPQGYGTMIMPNGIVVNGFWKNGQNVQIQSNVRVNGAVMTNSIIPNNSNGSYLYDTINRPPVGSSVIRN